MILEIGRITNPKGKIIAYEYFDTISQMTSIKVVKK